MQPTLCCYFLQPLVARKAQTNWCADCLLSSGRKCVCDGSGGIRPTVPFGGKCIERNATSFRSPKTIEINRREQKKKGLTELVKPFLVQLKPSRRWRKWRDSNPRGLAPKRFSRPPRCDRFDTLPYFLPLYQLSTRMSNCFWVFVGGNRVLLLLFICVVFKIVVTCFALYNNEIM